MTRLRNLFCSTLQSLARPASALDGIPAALEFAADRLRYRFHFHFGCVGAGHPRILLQPRHKCGLRRPTYFFLALLALAAGPTLLAAEPVFHLSFQNGLAPDIGPELEGNWTGEKPPQYYERGISGRALMVGDVDGSEKCPAVQFGAIPGTRSNGTMLFWMRGVRNWDLYRTAYCTPTGPSNSIATGGGTMWKWNYDTGGVKIYAGTPGPTYRQMFYPRFQQYRWTQIGYSWQDGHLRLYLNGELVNEDTNFGFDFSNFSLGGGSAHENSIRLYDELKIWDRALSKSEIKRLYRQDSKPANRPLITAGFMDSAPVIDGQIDHEEWAGAARVIGLLHAETGERTLDQSAFLLGYDAEFLYIAMFGDMTELARTSPALVYEKFVNVEGDREIDDLLEIILSPLFFQADLGDVGYWDKEKRHNISGSTGDTFFQTASLGNWQEYRLISNAGGNRHAAVSGRAGIDAEWRSNWHTASTVSHDGWQFEAYIPLSSLGRLPSAGEKWGLQLARLWRHLKQETDAWAWGYRELDGIEKRMYTEDATAQAGMGILRFGKSAEPVVQVWRTGILEKQDVDWYATIANPAAHEQEVKVKLCTDTPELSHTEIIKIPAGGIAEYSCQHRIADFATSSLTFEVRSHDDILLHRTCIPFYLEEKFGLNIRRFPNQDRFVLDLDLGAFSDVDVKELRVDLYLADTEGERVFRAEDNSVSGYVDSLPFATDSLAAGDYGMDVRIRRVEEELAREEMAFTKVAKAEWFDNRHGCEDMELDNVPYPWTDIYVQDDTVGVWGRKYRFAENILPEQVTVLDQPLLRAPVRLLVETPMGMITDMAQADTKSVWTEKKRTRVEGVRSATTGGIKFSNNFWVEYDGFVWNTLALEADKDMEISSLIMEFPLTPEFTDVNYRKWYGNGDGGIQFFGDIQAEMEETPQGGTVRINLIAAPITVASRVTVELGFIATPVRPKTWRTPEFQPPAVHGGGPWYPEGCEFMPAADIGRGYYGMHGRIYVHTNPVNRGDNDALGPHDFNNYVYEWLKNPHERVLSNQQRAMPTLKSKSYRDYFVWRHWRYQQRYGFAGLYYDNPLQDDILGSREVIKRMYNITLANHYFGAREQAVGMAVNGNINMSFMGFTTYHWDGEHLNSIIQNWRSYIGNITPESYRRQYMGHNLGFPSRFLGQRRMRPEWVEAAGGPEAVYDHLSGLVLLHDAAVTEPMLPCCVVPAAMEDVARRMTDALNHHNFYHWKYQFTPYWRQDIVALPQENMHASWYIAKPSALTATDPKEWSHRRNIFSNYFKIGRHLPDHIRARMPTEIEKERKHLQQMTDKAILILYNHSDWEGEMRLQVDWVKLGLGAPETLKAENAVHSTGFHIEKTGEKDKDGNEIEKAVFFPRPEETAKIENGELVFPMTKFNYRMIVIEKEE